MNQAQILSNNNNEFNLTNNTYIQYLYSNEINPIFIPKYNNQNYEEEILLENIKNIMVEPKINLIEDDIDDEIDSIYYIKNNNTSKIELQSTDNSTKIISLLEQDKLI